jgi:hypothetical protein
MTAATANQLLFIELNEVNFDFVRHYAGLGQLPAFEAFFARHGITETTSEKNYDELEPWIQWVTAHTGLDYADHQVFRLGDIVAGDLPQIWEQLEARGLKVGAVSPMNAKYRLQQPAFFYPDPWTQTDVVAPPVFRRLHAAIAEAVNNNASARLGVKSAVNLCVGGIAAAGIANYRLYATYLGTAISSPWRRALFLDLLLADLFMLSVKRTQPHFASLFLNAAAHIQHHYMFSSAAYDGPLKNPDWYVSKAADPVLDVYKLYDRILARIQKGFPDARVMLATGLHQDAHPEIVYYWRLRDHEAFLQKIGVPFVRVEPRMSRDFLIVCKDSAEAEMAAGRLERAMAADGTPLFEVDNRGTDLFVMLTYPEDIPAGMAIMVGNETFADFRRDVAFISLKNGQHNNVGYFSDSGNTVADTPGGFPLRDMPQRIFAALEGVA